MAIDVAASSDALGLRHLLRFGFLVRILRDARGVGENGKEVEQPVGPSSPSATTAMRRDMRARAVGGHHMSVPALGLAPGERRDRKESQGS